MKTAMIIQNSYGIFGI